MISSCMIQMCTVVRKKSNTVCKLHTWNLQQSKCLEEPTCHLIYFFSFIRIRMHSSSRYMFVGYSLSCPCMLLWYPQVSLGQKTIHHQKHIVDRIVILFQTLLDQSKNLNYQKMPSPGIFKVWYALKKLTFNVHEIGRNRTITTRKDQFQYTAIPCRFFLIHKICIIWS